MTDLFIHNLRKALDQEEISIKEVCKAVSDIEMPAAYTEAMIRLRRAHTNTLKLLELAERGDL